MEAFPLQLQSLLCWDLEMWNVATDKGHKKTQKTSERMAGFLWSVPINTCIQKRVSVFEERTWAEQHVEAFS